MSCKKETTDPLVADTNEIRIATSFFQSCSSCPNQIIRFRGIRPGDSSGTEPLLNPERGLRMETIMKVNDLNNPYHPINYTNLPAELLIDEKRYDEKTRLTQVYFYLTEYLGKSIPAQAFNNMQLIMDGVRKSGYKIILLFAYRYNTNCAYESYADIKRHLDQLKPFLQKNEALIFSVQAGFLGLWGEWHDTGLENSPYHKKVVIRDILSAIPAGRKMQVRETKYKTDAAGFIRRTAASAPQYTPLEPQEYNRIGFQNAYFVLDQGPYARFDYRWPDEDYWMVEKEALTTVVDGEMPYDGYGIYNYNELAQGNQGGWHAIKRMKIHAYSSFSVVHNYGLNIAAWKNLKLSAGHFLNENIAFDEDYFRGQNGEPVNRSAYEYIRDHLGYRFRLTEASIPKNIYRGDSASFSAQLKNDGFAPLINKRPVYFVLIDENNSVSEILTTADPLKWMPTRSNAGKGYDIDQKFYIPQHFKPGTYKVGIWMPDESASLKYTANYAVRLANGNMEYWTDPAGKYFVNIIGSFNIQ